MFIVTFMGRVLGELGRRRRRTKFLGSLPRVAIALRAREGKAAEQEGAQVPG